MLAVVARNLERRSALQAVRLLRIRSAYFVSEKDGSGAGGAANVVVSPAAATATVVTPNTQPNSHYTSSTPPTQPSAAATPPPPPPPPQPTQQKPVLVSVPPPSSPPPSSSYDSSSTYSRPRSARSSLRSRLTAFLVGVGVAAGAGYYRLQSDVWSSARALEGQIEGLRGAGGDSNRGLADRVAALEKRLAELEKDKGKK